MIICLLMVLFVSCSSIVHVQNPNVIPFDIQNDIFNTNNYPANTYIGISGRMTTHDKEVEYAKLHIAHQIAMHNTCTVDKGTITLYEGHHDYIFYDSNFDYDDSYIDELFEKIEVIETHIFSELVVVIGKDTQNTEYANPYFTRNINERPQWVNNFEWVRNFPGFNNYFVGVGFSEKYSLFYKGIIVADIKAAQSIASEKETSIRNYLYTNKTNIDSGLIALTQAELEGFYILDRWIEPDGSRCYSLGIANKF